MEFHCVCIENIIGGRLLLGRIIIGVKIISGAAARRGSCTWLIGCRPAVRCLRSRWRGFRCWLWCGRWRRCGSGRQSWCGCRRRRDSRRRCRRGSQSGRRRGRGLRHRERGRFAFRWRGWLGCGRQRTVRLLRHDRRRRLGKAYIILWCGPGNNRGTNKQSNGSQKMRH